MGTLYIVATPIGNLQDMSLRAIQTLLQVKVIACEDTRRAGLLLARIASVIPSAAMHQMVRGAVEKSMSFDSAQDDKSLNRPRLLSYYDQNETVRIPEIITLLLQGEDVALISDAGTPLISDPGFKLVRECAKHKIKITSIPGSCAAITALTLSGLPTDKFLFLGYLPHKASHARQLLENAAASVKLVKSTVVIYEAPHKLLKTLVLIKDTLGEREIVVCRELTKIYEEVRREEISQAITHFEKSKPKGEFVILF